jgi:hypothetical protein
MFFSDPSFLKGVDWQWIKSEVLNMRDKGIEVPIVTVNLLGEVWLEHFKESHFSDLWSEETNFEEEFILKFSENGFLSFLRLRWDKLI